MLRHPAAVTFWTEKEKKTTAVAEDTAQWNDIALELVREEEQIQVKLTAQESPVSFVSIRFQTHIDTKARILGDEWERTYGEMAWQPMIPQPVVFPHHKEPPYQGGGSPRQTESHVLLADGRGRRDADAGCALRRAGRPLKRQDAGCCDPCLGRI